MKNKINFISFIIRVILILISINNSLNYCNNISEPILLKKTNECVMKYCTEEEFNNEICIKDNNIIRIQWLNNIIHFGDENCRFTKIVKYHNGDIVVISQINPANSSAAYFYGLKENGRPLFIKNGIETPYNPLNNYINSNNNDIQYNESEVLIVKNETTGKEYLLILGKLNTFVELYNFESKNIDSQQSVYNIVPFFSDEYIISNARGSLFNLKNSKYFLYAGIFKFMNINNFLVLFKLSYEDNNILIKNQTGRIHSRGDMASCYETEDCEYIICFYLNSPSQRIYNILIYDNNLIKDTTEFKITANIVQTNYFFKCIHYEGNKGIFIYYDTINDEGPYPIILFKTKIDQDIIDWNSLSEIKLDSYIFEYSVNLNDLIKISNRTICFSSVSRKKDLLYIVMINIFDNESKIKIRYYIIRTFQLYNYKFYLDLRLYVYKKYIAITSSYCNQTDCENGDTHYSSLIIFSYPNSTDYNKNIVDELFDKNEILENLNLSLNLGNIVKIENNIFGLIYSKIIIKAIEDCDNIRMISSTKNTNIINGYELEKEEDINITFNNNDIFNCSIWYIYEITLPDYNEFEKYPEHINISYGNDNEEIFNNYKQAYSGRLSYYNLYLNDKLTKSCDDECGLCYDNKKKLCITCSNNNYTIKTDQSGIKYKFCSGQENEETEESLISDKLTYEKIENIETDKKNCTIEEIISLQCENGIVKDEQFQNLSNQFKNQYLNKDTYDRETKKIKTENVVLEITDIDKQDENDPSISYLDLGKCEEIIKKHYNIPEKESLIIYKADIKSEDLSTTYVQYEIYHPETLEQLEYLTICSNEKATISIPVNLNNDTKALYNSLNNSGYNLFDTNDSFYNDICATYTTENGTDINLNDRQHAIEDSGGNSNYCQVGCTMTGFNNNTQKAECNCDIKETKTVTNLDDILFPSVLINNIFEGLKYSNYLVLKCYKLLFDFELLKKNIGSIFMMIINISLFVIFLIYIIKGKNKIDYYIQAVLKNKSIYIKNRKSFLRNSVNFIHNKFSIENNLKNNENKNKRNSKKFSLKPKNNEENIKREKSKKSSQPPFRKLKEIRVKRKYRESHDINSSLKFVTKSNEIKNEMNNYNINIFPINNLNYRQNKKKEKDNSENKSLSQKNNRKKNSISINRLSSKKEFDNSKLKNNEKSQKVLDLNHINYKTLNIQELNNLEYKIAILVDKRTYLQYYCSLIRKKQLIIFTFIPIDDYNLVTLKISSFLLQFSLYLTINAFFFSDSTMHQIYTNNGNESFLYHIPQIIYSSLISTVINSILRHLSLSENDILSIKHAKLIKTSNKKANEVKVFLRIKFIIFFIVSFILTIFFWYFISCFCAVYKNTQVILIKDSLFSFGISMLYPFGLNLFPGFLRITSLRASNQDKICLYKSSQLLSII